MRQIIKAIYIIGTLNNKLVPLSKEKDILDSILWKEEPIVKPAGEDTAGLMCVKIMTYQKTKIEEIKSFKN